MKNFKILILGFLLLGINFSAECIPIDRLNESELSILDYQMAPYTCADYCTAEASVFPQISEQAAIVVLNEAIAVKENRAQETRLSLISDFNIIALNAVRIEENRESKKPDLKNLHKEKTPVPPAW